MKRLVALGLGLIVSAVLTGCCCTPCCSSPCGYGGGCGPGGCPAPMGAPVGGAAYYAPSCPNGSCGTY